MSNRDTQKAGPFPRFGILLDQVIEALDWNEPLITSKKTAEFFAFKTTDNYLKGLRVKPESWDNLVQTLVECLLQETILPIQEFAKLVQSPASKDDVSRVSEDAAKHVFVLYLQRLRDQYEALNSTLSETTPDHVNAEWAGLRLLAIEFGLRYGALLKLEKRIPDNKRTKQWSESSYPGEYLRTLLSLAAPNRPLYDSKDPNNRDWTDLLGPGLASSTLARWLNGQCRPEFENLQVIAGLLHSASTQQTNHKRDQILRDLRRHYALCHIVGKVRQAVGIKKTRNILDVFHETAAWTLGFLRLCDKQMQSPMPDSFLIRIICEGQHFEPTRRLLSTFRDALLLEHKPLGPDEIDQRAHLKMLHDDVDAWMRNRLVDRIRHYIECSRVARDFAKGKGATVQEEKLMPIVLIASEQPPIPKDSVPKEVLNLMKQHQGSQNNAADWMRLQTDMEAAHTQGDLREVERLARQGIHRFPQTGTFHYTLGRMLLLRNDLQEAEQEFRLAFELIPDVDLNTKTSSYIRIAHCLVKNGQAIEAIQHLEQPPFEVPQNHRAEIRYMTGIALQANGQFKEAVNALNDAALGDFCVGECYARAAWCCEKIGDRPKQREFEKKARELGAIR